MKGKKEKQFLFEVQLKWLKKFTGKLSEKNINKSIKVTIPHEFGGKEKMWTPENLFLGAISASFMCTFLAYTKKFKFKISHLECDTIGQIEIVEHKYKFTNINVYPKIYILDETIRKKANLALEKTHQHCLIINSTNADVFYHSEVKLNSEYLKTDSI